jgi:hypothetical protein
MGTDTTSGDGALRAWAAEQPVKDSAAFKAFIDSVLAGEVPALEDEAGTSWPEIREPLFAALEKGHDRGHAA